MNHFSSYLNREVKRVKCWRGGQESPCYAATLREAYLHLKGEITKVEATLRTGESFCFEVTSEGGHIIRSTVKSDAD